MIRASHILRKLLIIPLLPLVAFGGQWAGGCVCADGHFEPFCNGRHDSWAVSKPGESTAQHRSTSCCSSHQTCPIAAAKRHNSNEGPLTCGQSHVDGSHGVCCSRLENAPVLLAKRFVTQLESELVAIDDSVSQIYLPTGVERKLQACAAVVRSPRDMLILFQHFLI